MNNYKQTHKMLIEKAKLVREMSNMVRASGLVAGYDGDSNEYEMNYKEVMADVAEKYGLFVKLDTKKGTQGGAAEISVMGPKEQVQAFLIDYYQDEADAREFHPEVF